MTIPKLLWAQDNEHLFITVDIRDLDKNNTTITENTINIDVSDFGDKNYQNIFHLNSKIKTDSFDQEINSRYLKLKIYKEDQGFWEHLLIDSQKKQLKNFVNIDWSLWKDEEDDTEVTGMPGMEGGMPGGMDLSQMMASMGGGMPGMEDGMPDLDESTPDSNDETNEIESEKSDDLEESQNKIDS